MKAVHRMRVRAPCGLLFAAALTAAGAAVQAQPPTATDPARYRPAEQAVVMKGGGLFGGDLKLAGTYWRPPQGDGPLPRVLPSHGSNAEVIAADLRLWTPAAETWLRGLGFTWAP